MALCVRMPRPFALITGWMAKPLLAWCSFFLFVFFYPLKWLSSRASLSARIAKLNSHFFRQAIRFVPANVPVRQHILFNGCAFVFCFYGRFGAHLADENPRRFIFYDSLFLPNSNPKPVRFAFDMMMMCFADKPITINISSFSCSYRQRQCARMNGGTQWTQKQAIVCEMWHWVVAVAPVAIAGAVSVAPMFSFWDKNPPCIIL